MIDYRKIVEDIAGDKYEIFLHEFDGVKLQVEEIHKKPKCEGCVIKNIPLILAYSKAKEKLETIYGTKEEIDMTIPKPIQPPKFDPRHVVLEIDPDYYPKWFADNVKATPDKRVQFFNAYYNSDKKKVIVSMVEAILVK